MRTTLSLDPDVAALLTRVRQARKSGLKRVINEALRHGLQQMITPSKPRRRFRTQGVSLGRCLAGNLDDISEALAVAEGEAFR